MNSCTDLITTTSMKYLTLLLLLIPWGISSAQEFQVERFETMHEDLSARVNPRVGINGRKCALLKVYVQDEINHVNGSCVGDIISKGIEKWIYMAHDSRQVEIVFRNHFPLRIKFDDYNVPVLTEQTVYVVRLIDTNLNTSANHSDNFYESRCLILDKANELYQQGLFASALELYMSISDDKEAQWNIGRMYESSEVFGERDYVTAVEWFEKSAGQGYAPAEFSIGRLFDFGVCPDGERGLISSTLVGWSTPIFFDGSEEHDRKYGKNPNTFFIECRNSKMAAEWYKKASEHGHTEAQFLLGKMYLEGDGVEKSPSDAVLWIRKSAENGYVGAEFKLAEMYRHGEVLRKDYNSALRWYRNSVENGDVRAIHAVGAIYESTGDFNQAIAFYKKAAEKDYSYSIIALAKIYVIGKGVPANEQEAMEWFEKASKLDRRIKMDWNRFRDIQLQNIDK